MTGHINQRSASNSGRSTGGPTERDGFRGYLMRRPSHAVVVLVFAGIFAYSNTLFAPFIYDGLSLKRQLRTITTDPATWLRPPPRTVGYLTFDVQNTVHGGWLPGYHFVNIAIHIAASVCLFWLIYLTIVKSPACRRLVPAAVAIGAMAALIFELHPLQTQSVTYLYQRFESLMGALVIASMLLFCHSCFTDSERDRRSVAYLVASGLAICLAIGTKESGAMAPFVLLWFDRVFVSPNWKILARQRGWFYGLFGVVFAGGVIFLYLNRSHYVAGGIFDTETVGPLLYAFHQPYVILRYLQLFFWPQGLCLDWNLQFQPPSRLIPALAAVVALGVYTLWAAWRRPVLGFLLGAFFLTLAPTSSFAPIRDLAYEHRMYLPVAPLGVLVVGLAREVMEYLSVRPTLKWLAAGAVVVALGVTTYRRNEVYNDGVVLWVDVIKKAPYSARARLNLGVLFEEQGRKREAIEMYLQALQLAPQVTAAHVALAELLLPFDRGRAIYHARKAVEKSRSADNLNNLGMILVGEDPDEAERCFRESLAKDPNHFAAGQNLKRLLEMLQQRKPDKEKNSADERKAK